MKLINGIKRNSNAALRIFGLTLLVSAVFSVSVLAHQPLGVALAILLIEWMSQIHYTDSIKDNSDLDAQFKSLLKNHWLEEAQHAKLDTVMVEALADGMTEAEIEKAVDEFLEIGGILDEGTRQQAIFDMEAFG